MKKIGICTLYTGYNFGSALQAYATKEITKEMGYDANVIKLSGSLVKGRDIRIKKMIIFTIRMLLFSNNKKKVIESFNIRKNVDYNEKINSEFNEFYDNFVKPDFVSYYHLKRKAKDNSYLAFICGSDQIWNSTTFYIDPFYYLRFAPKEKRIAYAPSFGRTYIPKYNQKKIAKYISEIPNVSVRENSGKDIICKLINKEVKVCLDPTLLLDQKQWCEKLDVKEKEGSNYIFCYFLNEPSDKANKFINDLSKNNSLKVIFINKCFGDNVIYGGPKTFIEYLKNASYVVTDSFHGVAFSINFHKFFYVFDRQYLTENQSTRIKSLLDMVNMSELFECEKELDISFFDYNNVDKIIELERRKSINYLKNSIELSKKNEK